MTVALFVVVVAAMAACGQAGQPHYPQTVTVSLSQGAITGAAQSAGHGRYFYSFKGIPYANPPVGSLRLRDPVRAGPWHGTRDSSRHPPPCPQLQHEVVIGSEDCLYLNVFTPASSSGMLPVMVYIHGGSFVSGGAADYPALPLLTEDVVLVVLQYRLGLLGFLSTEDLVLPGNLGLKDQTLALQWVQDNIRNLGGDPAKVTLFGDGSGAASVHFHILSPYSRGLFSRAILQSGSSLCPGTLRADHYQTAHRLALRFNCWDPEGSSDSWQLLKCLQGVPHHQLAAAYTEFHVWSDQPVVTVPRVDGDYLPHQPVVLLKSGSYNKVDLISGFAQHDGFVKTAPLYRRPHLLQELQNQPSVIGPVALNFDEEETSAHLAGISFHYYHGSLDHQGTSEHGKADVLTQLFTERLFTMCHEDTALLHAATSPGNSLFLYELQHSSPPSFQRDSLNLTAEDHWMSLPETVQYLFDGGLNSLTDPDDLLLSRIMVQLWTSFAASGDPTPDASLGFKWSVATESSFHHLALTLTPTMHEDTHAQVRAFWHSLPTRQNEVLSPDSVGAFRVINEEESAQDITAKDSSNAFQPMDTTGKDQVAGLGDHQADEQQQRQPDEGASSTLTLEEPEATTDKGDPMAVTDRGDPMAVTDRGDPKAIIDREDPKAVIEREVPKTGTDREDPKTVTDRGDPKTGTDREDPKTGTDREDPKAVADREDPKTVTDREDPKTGTDRGDPKTGTDREDPKTVTDREDPKTGIDREDPKAATDRGDPNSTAAAAVDSKECSNNKAEKLFADFSVKKRKLDYGDLNEILINYKKARDQISSGPPLLLSSKES